VNENNGAGRGVIDTIAHTIEANTSRRAFGDPLTFGEVTIIPAARVVGRGGGGGGGGDARPGAEKGAKGEGSGGGLMQSARPVGALVVKGSEVSWRPALDLNRIILGGQVVAVVGLLVLRSFLKARRRQAGHRQAVKAERAMKSARAMKTAQAMKTERAMEAVRVMKTAQAMKAVRAKKAMRAAH
jgi:uncharacterized spore protein YtfJ